MTGPVSAVWTENGDTVDISWTQDGTYLTDPTLAVDAAVEASTSAVGDILAGLPSSSHPASPVAEPLVIAGGNDAETWLQAEGSIDEQLNIALPTDAAMDALRKKGVPSSAGTSSVPASGGFLLVGENDEPTWLQAAPYLSDVTGAAPPTKAALATLAGEGVVILSVGQPPDAVPDLAPGEVRAYFDASTGELTIDIGEND